MNSNDIAIGLSISVSEGQLQIGDVSTPIQTPSRPELVPQPLYYDIPKHTLVMKQILQVNLTWDTRFLDSKRGYIFYMF